LLVFYTRLKVIMRCFIRPEAWHPGDLLPDEEESHHLLRVLRIQPGQQVEVFDGQGRTGTAEFVSSQGAQARLRLVTQTTAASIGPRITLVQALPREQKMDWIIQKAVELGVHAIQPVQTEHCVVQIREDRAADKKARWEKIALNAAKQCGTAFLPQIFPARTLEQALKNASSWDLILVGALMGETRSLREVLRSTSEKPSSVAVLIGPEGDFTSAELERSIQAGAIPVSFGDTVLRAETAALFALSVLRYEFSGA
jgi:16S rRNA (uracil1498-N3)-methyltransferase